MKNKIVAVIPARGGSKGIVKKNLQKLKGRPLISITVRTALDSNVNEVWTSTDSKEISDAALDAGAKATVRRPAELCKDDSNSEEALLHFAEKVEFDTLVFLQCTSPLTTSEDINGALDLFATGKYDSVLSVCKDSGGWHCGGFTWKREIRLPEYEGTSYQTAVRETTYSHQRQDMEDRFRENGAIYVTSRDNLLKSKSRLSGKIGLYVMPQSRSFEIDEPEDLETLRRYLAYKEPTVLVYRPAEEKVDIL